MANIDSLTLKQMQIVYDKCKEVSPDLFGYSVVDLLADKFTNMPLNEIREYVKHLDL